MRRIRGSEVTVAAFFLAAIAWTAVTGARGNPAPVMFVLAGSLAVLLVARLAAARSRLAVPAAVLAAAAIVTIAGRHELLHHEPLSGPFGYANAKGAFFMVAAIAGLMIVAGSSNGAVQVVGAVGAVAAALVPPAAHVVASTVLLIVLALPVLVVSSFGRRAERSAIALCGSLFLIALVATALLGARDWSRTGSSAETQVRQLLTFNRLELWHEAEELMWRNPWRGIGPGRFGDVAPLSRREVSGVLFWAQNDFLQQGAEQGVTGLIIVVGLFASGFVALWVKTDADAFVALAAAALAAAGIQACEDSVLHFPAVAFATAALVGAGMAPRRPGRTVEVSTEG
jgi:O-antigen ligase